MGNPKVLNNYGSFDVTFVKGNGSTLTDINGKNGWEYSNSRLLTFH